LDVCLLSFASRQKHFYRDGWQTLEQLILTNACSVSAAVRNAWKKRWRSKTAFLVDKVLRRPQCYIMGA
jgi:hypothetical protein